MKNLFNKKQQQNKSLQNEVDMLISSLQKTAEGVGSLALEIVEISGRVDIISDKVQKESELFHELTGFAEQLTASNKTVDNSVNSAKNSINDATKNIEESKSSLVSSISEIRELSEAVTESGDDLEKLNEDLKQVKKITQTITSISKQTNMLALNATIEAARAGSSGKGFAVVADEVKELSKKTNEATTQIGITIGTLASQIEKMLDRSRENTRIAENVREDAQEINDVIALLENNIFDIDSQSERIVNAVEDINISCANTVSGLEALTSDVKTANETLKKTKDRINNLKTRTEDLIRHTIVKGVETVDTPMIDMAIDIANRVGKRFEKALESGEITENALFDFNYKAIEGSNPTEYETGFTKFCDKVMPEFQEPPLENKRIATCTASDTNGYIPRHINARNLQQKPNDPEWNNINCRSKRIFNDNAGMAAAKNNRKFLLQTYRIPFIDDQWAVLKDCSAPIIVRNRHWGCIRITYDIIIKDASGNDMI